MTKAGDPLVFERRGLDVGLELVLQSAPPGAQSLAATYVGPAGWAYDPPGLEGLARLTSALAPSGVGPYDRVALARRLDRAGATLTSQCAPETAEVTVWGPADEFPELVHLLAEAVLHPRFDPPDVRRVLRQFQERQLREATQPAHRADLELLHGIFPQGHPYRETGLGDRSSLRRLGRRSVVDFHRRHYAPEGGFLIVTSPLTARRVVPRVTSLFREFATRKVRALPIPKSSSPKATVQRVPLAGRTQVEVRIGGPSLARSDPLFPAAALANELLGGRPLLSRLFQAVREKEGLAYHASSELEAMRWGGYWAVQAGTGSDRWRRVVRVLEDELNRLRERTVSVKELTLVRESAIGEIPLSLETTSEAHELAVDAAYHHLPEDHWKRWPDRLRAVTPSELRDAAQRGFAERGSLTVLAGPLSPP